MEKLLMKPKEIYMYTLGAFIILCATGATVFMMPTAGTVYFCTDCTGNGFTGHPVYYAASMWRRWD